MDPRSGLADDEGSRKDVCRDDLSHREQENRALNLGEEKREGFFEERTIASSPRKVNSESERKEGDESSPRDRLEESRSKIEALQGNLGTKIHASTAQSYKERLSSLLDKETTSKEIEANSPKFLTFDQEFLKRHRLEERLEIEEKSLVETECWRKPRYSKKVLEVEKRWSGEFLEHRSPRNFVTSTESSSSSSSSSYVGECGSGSSHESVLEESRYPGGRRDRYPTVNEDRSPERSIDENAKRPSEEFLEVSVVSTLDSDSSHEEVLADRGDDPCLAKFKEASESSATEPRTDGYARFIREITMESVAPRAKKEEKQKKKSALRRLLPGFFSPKDSRKDYKKKDRKERRKQDERHFTRYQQNGNYTRSPDTMNLNEDIKRNVKLDNSLNGSIIEERLDEIKRELFPEQGLITSTPDHFSQGDSGGHGEGRKTSPYQHQQQQRGWSNRSDSKSSVSEDRWFDRKVHLPDDGKYDERRIQEEVREVEEKKQGEKVEKMIGEGENRRLLGCGQLERKHSLQEASRGDSRIFFQRNHGPSGRISAPPSERYLARPKAVRPIDRPLPAIPLSRIESSEYQNFEREDSRDRGGQIHGELSYDDSVLTEQNRVPPVRQTVRDSSSSNERTGNKYPSPGSSQKSADYADSCCTPNSSQKSEFSPTSSKSGEYYLPSPRNSARTSPSGQTEGIYVNETRPSENPDYPEVHERVYDETPPSPLCETDYSPEDSIERSGDGLAKRNSPKDSRATCANVKGPSSSRGSSTTGNTRKAQPGDQILIASPKRDVIYDRRQALVASSDLERVRPESPVTITSSPTDQKRQNASQGRVTSSTPLIRTSTSVATGCSQTKNLQRPEPVYASSAAFVEGAPPRETNWVRGRADPRASSQERIYASKGSLQRESVTERQRSQRVPSTISQSPREAPNYHGQSCPITGCAGTVSPSKRRTMQHLEAFYWQQKALEAHRRTASVLPPTNEQPRTREKENSPKINLPEIREAVYWQQLKKLDEEQQRRIYERNAMEESMAASTGRRSLRSVRCPPATITPNGSYVGGRPIGGSADRSYRLAEEAHHRPSKATELARSGMMHGPKASTQPVLVVRPQQQQATTKSIDPNSVQRADPRMRLAPRRSKSASPHLRANRPLGKPENTVCIYVEENELEGKQQRPHPIFKRGSLVSSDSVEYAGTGPKRVSFSNQNVGVGPAPGVETPTGNWPTKRGTASEPPTRRHRSEDSVSDTDSVFARDQPNREFLYVDPPATCSRNLESSYGYTTTTRDYDADRPLPPLPKEVLRWNDHRKWPTLCESESGSEAAGEVQRIFARNDEEDWNPDGKGRQSNDTGGSGRVEGEVGSNELTLTPGRRSIGVVGGSVVGVGGGGGGGGGTGIGVVGGIGGGNVGSGGGGGNEIGGRAGSGSTGSRSRDEPRRHTLGGGDHQPSLHHQQFNAGGQQLHPLHPRHLPPPHSQYGTMDLEMGTKSRQRKSPLPRGYPPPSSTMLFDDDPGIMSEVETSSTGFRRGGKQRSSLPVVRTPSKTLERPLGLVFLQYRNETKRALLPNEITSIDTVKALFVRSFPKQLTMEYLDSPHVKVYIHDSNKNVFYELEDHRLHLRDIRDRSVLKLFESADGVAGMPGPLGIPGSGALPPHWEDQSYFSEPEFDSEYQHQHIHKSKTAKNSNSGSGGYYVGGSSTLPRGGPLLRAYSPAASSVVAGPNATAGQPKPLATPGGGAVPPAKPLRSYQCGKSPLGSLGGSARFSRDSSVSLYSIPDRLHGESGYMSSPERGGGVGSATGRYPPGPYSTGSSYEEPYYSQYSGTVTPVIDEEASDTELLEESYSLYGVKPPGRPPSGPPRSPFIPPAAAPIPTGQSYDATRIRVEHMERQLANLTGLVHKALTHAPHTSPSPRDYLQVPASRDPYARSAGAGDEFDKHSSSSSASLPDDSFLRTDVKPPKLGKDKSVSFEKSVSFSDEPPDMNSPKQHSPQHAADTKPTKPAIKSSTLPRMSSQERDRHKPTPPPKPAALVAGQYVYRDLALTPEMYNQLRGLQKKAKDLRQDVRNLRRMSQSQAHTVRETIRDTFITIRAMLLSGGDAAWTAGDAEKTRLSREEDLYKQEMLRLEKDLTELESTVEELRGNVINRKTRVNMSDVENMALILNKSSKAVADLKVRFPNLQEGMKGLLSSEMEKIVREEKFLKEEPERLESALKRCKKLTGTLVTLKRLASVQEQRLPNAASVDTEETPPITPTSAQHSKAAAPVPTERTVLGSTGILGGGSHPHEPSAAHQQRPENALDALLDELQTFSRPGSQMGQAPMASVIQPTTTTLATAGLTGGGRAPCISEIGRKGSVDSSSGILTSNHIVGAVTLASAGTTGTLRRLHSYPSSSDTDTSPPIARLQVSLQEQPGLPQTLLPQGQKPPVPERNAELLQLASARRVPPPPPPRTSSRSPLASPTSPQLPPRNHPSSSSSSSSSSCTVAQQVAVGNATGATLRRPLARPSKEGSIGKPPMALPSSCNDGDIDPASVVASTVLSTSNSSSCESVNSQEGLQSKRGRQEQLEQRHQELLRKQKALQEQYARLQQLQRNAAGLATVPPAPPDLLKKTGSESNLLAKMGLGMSAASSGSLTSLTVKTGTVSVGDGNSRARFDGSIEPTGVLALSTVAISSSTATTATTTVADADRAIETVNPIAPTTTTIPSSSSNTTNSVTVTSTTTTTSKIYETDIL